MNLNQLLIIVAGVLFIACSHSIAQENTTATGEIHFYSATKPAWSNQSYMCTLAGNAVWMKSLHDNSARGIYGRRCRGDRARHIALVGPIAAGTIIQVLNNRNASITKPGDSSYAVIRIRQDIATNQTLIIGSFEGWQSNPLLGVFSYCNMGRDGRRWCPARGGDYLDSKVSYVRVFPPRSAEAAEFEAELSADDSNEPELNFATLED